MENMCRVDVPANKSPVSLRSEILVPLAKAAISPKAFRHPQVSYYAKSASPEERTLLFFPALS